MRINSGVSSPPAAARFGSSRATADKRSTSSVRCWTTSTPIIQWPVHGGDNQVWTLEPASDGYVRIVARHSGKAMDVEGASVDEGARVIQYTPHGGANQQWLLRKVSTLP